MTLARLLLGLLAAFAAVIGVWARFASRAFYTDFPVGGWDWVSRLGPYNEHLVGDFGGTTLALAAITAIAVARPHRQMVVAACAGWEVASVRHLIFHLGHLEPFSAAQQVLMLIVLLAPIVLPAAALRLSAADHRS